MDTFLVIASRREVRAYAERPLPDDVVERIVQAGRVAGSSRNRQPWRFHLLASPEVRQEAAETVFAPENLRGAALGIAISVCGKGPTAFDAGRAAQNMMLAAADEGVGSCPNGVADADALAALLELGEDERVVTVLSLGYPARPLDPTSRTPEAWLARADRKPVEEIVRRL
jgi:nitroreductase